MSAALKLVVRGIGVLGPGLNGWPALRAVLRGELPWQAAPTVLPTPQALPAAERRRVGAVVRLALAAGFEALGADDATTLATVFASAGGDGANCHAICDTLAGNDRLISPTRFHNSVNNATCGYWGIATGAHPPSTIVSAGDASFGAGLLAAAAQVVAEARPVLLIAYDHAYPEPLAAARPMGEPMAVALVLAPAGDGIGLRLALGDAAPATPLADPALEALRQATPAGRALPMLAMLAAQAAGPLWLMAGGAVALRVEREAAP